MDCEATRILHVSLSKITDSRRCRGGPLLRRNLLVSQVLNNVLTSTDAAYCKYRSKVETDMDIDGVENELVSFDKSKMNTRLLGGSLDTGNTTHTASSEIHSNERTTEIKPITAKNARKNCRDYVGIEKTMKGKKDSDAKEKKSGDKCVTGSKRARPHVNEPCDSHAVQHKRFKTENPSESSVTEVSYQEPMDISGLVNVFNSSFSGLASIPNTPLSAKLESFQCISTVQPVRGVFGWSQPIVEAF